MNFIILFAVCSFPDNNILGRGSNSDCCVCSISDGQVETAGYSKRRSSSGLQR